MLSDEHPFFSDPHIGDPMSWIESHEDPMLHAEYIEDGRIKKIRERMQLLFGVFFLLLIVTFSSSVSNNISHLSGQAAVIETNIIKPTINPLPTLPPPTLSAHGYLVKFIGYDIPLLRQREEKMLAPASLTKILTAAIAKEELPSDAVITISKTARTAGGKMSTVPVGTSFRRDDALEILLVESDNDFAYAVAEAVEKLKTGKDAEPGFPEFMNLMNVKAAAIGMKNSNFANPAGLDQDEHLTTATDLGTLVEYIWEQHPEIWEMTKNSSAKVNSLSGQAYPIKTTDELLKEFPALKGGKTGYTTNAKGALILLYPVHPSYTAVVVLLGSEDRFGDGRKVIEWLQEAFP